MKYMISILHWLEYVSPTNADKDPFGPFDATDDDVLAVEGGRIMFISLFLHIENAFV